MRYLGLDYGDARIGLAITDPLGITVRELETYKRKDEESDLKYILEIIEKYDIVKLIVGLPLNMDGTSGDRVEVTKEFVDKLKQKNKTLNIKYQDERLTSEAANRIMVDRNIPIKKRKGQIDQISAAIILQDYLMNK